MIWQTMCWFGNERSNGVRVPSATAAHARKGALTLLFLIRRETGDASLNANVALYRSNARLAAQVAVALAKQ